MPIARNLERAPLHLSCRQLESPQTSPDCNFQTRFIAKKMLFLGFSGPGERIPATSLQSRGFRPQGRRLLTFNPSPKGFQGYGRDPSWELHRKGKREPKTLSAVIVRVSLPESKALILGHMISSGCIGCWQIWGSNYMTHSLDAF